MSGVKASPMPGAETSLRPGAVSLHEGNLRRGPLHSVAARQAGFAGRAWTAVLREPLRARTESFRNSFFGVPFAPLAAARVAHPLPFDRAEGQSFACLESARAVCPGNFTVITRALQPRRNRRTDRAWLHPGARRFELRYRGPGRRARLARAPLRHCLAVTRPRERPGSEQTRG